MVLLAIQQRVCRLNSEALVSGHELNGCRSSLFAEGGCQFDHSRGVVFVSQPEYSLCKIYVCDRAKVRKTSSKAVSNSDSSRRLNVRFGIIGKIYIYWHMAVC